MDWCVERGEMQFSRTRRIDWISDLERKGDVVVVREQLYRPWDTGVGKNPLSFQFGHSVFDWDLHPEFAADEFSLARAGAGSLGPPRPIPWYRHWYFATAALGVLLTMYA